jgi:hypothetical protein
LENVTFRVAELTEFTMLGQPQEHLLDQILDLCGIAGALAKKTREGRIVTPRQTIQARPSLFVLPG